MLLSAELVTRDTLTRANIDPGSLRVFALLGLLVNALAPRVGIQPSAVWTLARLETGRNADFEAESHNYYGVDGEWGPILSGRTAELWGVPAVRVDRDWYRWATASDGTSRKWRAYPSMVHGVLDILRMLSTMERYRPTTADAREQLRNWYLSGYSSPDTASQAVALYDRLFR